MTTIYGKVTDPDGNPLSGVQIKGHYSCGSLGFIGGGGNNLYTTTDSDGNWQYDTTCLFGGSATVQFIAEGYETKTENYSFPMGGGNIGSPDNPVKTVLYPVPVNPIKIGNSYTCPDGYVLQNGQCYLKTVANKEAKYWSWIKDNWLLIVIFIFIAVFIFILIKKPEIIHKTTKSITEGTSQIIKSLKE